MNFQIQSQKDLIQASGIASRKREYATQEDKDIIQWIAPFNNFHGKGFSKVSLLKYTNKKRFKSLRIVHNVRFILTHGNQVQVFAVNNRALDILNLSKCYYLKMDPFKVKKYLLLLSS